MATFFPRCFRVLVYTEELQYNERPRDWQIFLAIMTFRYIEVLFHIFCYYWGKENQALYQGLRYIEVCYIEVPLYSALRPKSDNGIENYTYLLVAVS